MKPILQIGLAGFGTVGAGVWKHLARNADLLTQRTGVTLRITRIATRTTDKALAAGVPAERVSSNILALAQDPDVHVVVELIGGTTLAYELIQASLKNGKHVVTANKALLAERGEELFRLARDNKVQLLFEASVAGGIPIIKALREGLAANHILSVHGIINGTCNYILTQMDQRGLEYSTALAEAKAGGYAEADESLDVEGHDAAHKACILAALAYGFWIPLAQLPTEGISRVQRTDVVFARKLGYALKLLAVIKTDAEGLVECRVQPTLLPSSHVLASVNGVFNAIVVRGDVVGDTLFYGRGAGADATSSAVLSDLVEIARAFPDVPPAAAVGTETLYARVRGLDDTISRHYLRLQVQDTPGVLAKVATILANHQIGISSVIQPEGSEGEAVPLILMLHDAKVRDFETAVKEIEALPVVKSPAVSLRVEDFE